LENLGVLTFGDYADWPSALLEVEKVPLLWVLFLEDVLSPEAGQETAIEDTDRLFDAALAPLRGRLQAMQTPVVVAWSTWRPHGILQDARRCTAWRRAARRIGDILFDLAAHSAGLYLIDLDNLLSKIGTDAAFDARNFYSARCRLSGRGISEISSATAEILRRTKEAAKKVLVLDCDNTLWGGVIGEVGLSGIALGGDGKGKAFADFQRGIRRLAAQGILLAISSKNNEVDVWEMFERHGEMVLKRSDVVAARIDWNDKSDNIIAIAEDLDLGLDSFVFWDDNPIEREKMRLALPRVTTIDVPLDVESWPALLDRLELFSRFSITDEDRKKTQQYHNRMRFVTERANTVDKTSFLRSIAMCPKAVAVNDATVVRAEQLSAKTNQYNLRPIRYTAAEILALAAANDCVTFLTSLSDKFGDHGIVGFSVARPVDDDAAFLDTFLMSCRVLGRDLEAWMFATLAARLHDAGVSSLYAEFWATERNVVAAQVLPQHGFKRVSGKDGLQMKLAAAGLETKGGDLYCADIKYLTRLPGLEVFETCPVV